MEPRRPPSARELAAGSSTGALFMTVFGAVWGAAGSQALGGVAGKALLVSLAALAAALFFGAVKLRRGALGLPGDDSKAARERRGRSSRRFNLVFGLEGVAIALAVVLLGRSGMGAFVPAVVAIIVGVHFFPLAELFKVRAYHATGAALCVLGIVAFILAPQARLPFVGLGCAAMLFATAAYMLYLGVRARRRASGAA
jgi:hypothetical protein